jgi:hypothetical protein
MPKNGSHPAHDYAEPIRERLPRRLQEVPETAGFTQCDALRRCVNR